MKKIIRGKNCSLLKFEAGDEKLVDLIYKLFHDENITGHLNPDYPLHKPKPTIRKWVKETAENPYGVWYIIKYKQNYIGYVCYKWREHYDEACEISTAILFEYRGLKLGYESSKLLADYVKNLKKFKYLVAYVHKGNKRAENNLKKFGLSKANRLQKTVTIALYNEDGSSGEYDLFALKLS
jgi:RimJ/RimL family protein N-acetyltransferase